MIATRGNVNCVLVAALNFELETAPRSQRWWKFFCLTL